MSKEKNIQFFLKMRAKKVSESNFCKVARSLPSNEKAKAGITNDGWTGEGEEEELKRKEAFFISYPLLFLIPVTEKKDLRSMIPSLFPVGVEEVEVGRFL